MEARLRSSPEARLELLQESGLECQLRILLKTAPVVYSESVDAETVDVAEDALPPPRATIRRWRPAWLWIPVAAAAAALLVALALPLFPAHHRSRIAGRGTTEQEHVSVAVGSATQPMEETIRESEDTEIPSGIAAQPAPHADDGASAAVGPSLPVETAIAAPESGFDHRMSERSPDASSGNPSAVAQFVAPRFPASFNPAGGRGESVVVLTRPAGVDSEGNHANGAASFAVASVSSAVAVVTAVRRKSDGIFVSASGKILLTRVRRSARNRRAVQAGDSFLPGDVIETGPFSGGTLRYADGATVRLYSDTHLALGPTDRNRTLFLASGAVDLQALSQGSGGTFTVRTSSVEARGAGLIFAYWLTAASWVGVKAGRVSVSRFGTDGETVLLDSGTFASAVHGEAPASMLNSSWRSKCQAFTGSPRYQ